ncbi:MAG: flagellar hook-length control protein FliK [Glaciecola sp.]|jgi:flagellar hook-length control protein FliK
MQQFATAQTTIAASNIAFEEIQVNSPVSRESAGSQYDNSQQRSAFEEALARQEKQAENRREPERNDNKRNSQVQDKNAEQAQLSRERAQESQEARNRKRDEQAEQSRLDNERNRDSDKQTSSTNNASSTERSEPTNRGSASSEKQSEEHCVNCEEHQTALHEQAKLSEASEEQRNIDEILVAEKAAAQKEASSQSGKSENEAALAPGEEFNWVDYVDRIKDLSDKNISNDLYIDDSSNNEDFFKQALDSLALTSTKNASDSSDEIAVDSVSDIVTEETDTEFLEIHLSEKELEALLKASGVEKELSLHGDALEELDKAITSLLQQLMDRSGPSEADPAEQNLESQQEALGASEVDASLLKNLLLSSEQEAKAMAKANDAKLQALDNENAVPNESLSAFELAQDEFTDQEKVPQPIEGSIDDALLAGIKPVTGEVEGEKVAQPLDSELKPNQNPNIDTLKEDVIDESALISASTLASTGKSEGKEAKVATVAPLVLSMGDKSAKKQLEVLAKLPPEAEAAALENITQRLETTISDLKTEGKATEFIAALQSGVKEMKEQLKQGREPGIDLKSLVNEALASAEVKVPRAETAGVDKQLTQINNILSAASSINQSAQTLQSQNYLNTGLSEVQGVKEIAQQQLESTKLAQQTLNSDKAVNIFKPEGQQQLTEKVRWMVNSRNLSAEIRLDPPDLGGMNIKVNINGDSASVSFVVQSQQARDALDQAVPRLREMLEEQGIELGQSSVEQDSSGQNQSAEQDTMAKNANVNGNLAQQSQDGVTESQEEHASNHIEQRISGASIGGIDYYA